MKNKHGIVSALISAVLIISFFMPFLEGGGESVSTLKFFQNVKEMELDNSWLSTLFFIYIGLIGLNILVQLASGSKGFSSFVGVTGIGFMILFVIVVKSEDYGSEQLKFFKEYLGSGVWVSGLSALALIIVPQWFEDEKDEEFDNLINKAEAPVCEAEARSSQPAARNDSTTEIDLLKAKIAQYKEKNNTTLKADEQMYATKTTETPIEQPTVEKPKAEPVNPATTTTTEMDELKAKITQLEKQKLEMEIARLKNEIDAMKKNNF